MQLSSLYVAKNMAIPDFFQEFLTFFIQANSKIPNFKYDVIWKLQYAQNDTKCSSLACM
jgi:hypothetical protein